MKSCLVTLVLLVLPALAQRPVEFNVGTPEGQLLKQIGEESDPAKKVALMEDFLGKYPKHEGVAWVGGQLTQAYTEQKNFDKALAAADKAYSGGPNDVDLGFKAIKAAEGKEDVEQVKKWAVRTGELAQKVANPAKAPTDADEKADADHAKEVAAYAEYSLYAQVLKSRDTKVTVDLGETLEKVNPKSPYLWLASTKYLGALGPKGCATAAKMAVADSKNAEAFLFAADCSWRGANAAGVVSNASRALEALGSRAKVDGGNEGAKSGTANFFVGIGNAMQQRWGPANKALRAALPALRGESIYEANALFNLGMANYTLGKAIGDKGQMRDGLHFFEQAAAIKSNVQDQASRNATLIRGELGGK
jgi:tetratricopeptide (TPR) repeat protein